MFLSSCLILLCLRCPDCLREDWGRPYRLCCLLSWAGQVWYHSGPYKLCCCLLHRAAAGSQGKLAHKHTHMLPYIGADLCFCTSSHTPSSSSSLATAKVRHGPGVRGPGGGDGRWVQRRERGWTTRRLHVLSGRRSGQNHYREQGVWSIKGGGGRWTCHSSQVSMMSELHSGGLFLQLHSCSKHAQKQECVHVFLWDIFTIAYFQLEFTWLFAGLRPAKVCPFSLLVHLCFSMMIKSTLSKM